MNWLSRWLRGVLATTDAMIHRPRRGMGGSPAPGLLISAAGLLLLVSCSNALAQTRAEARTILSGIPIPYSGPIIDYNAGDTAASANSNGFYTLLGFNTWEGEMSAWVDASTFDGFLRSRIATFGEVGGDSRGMVSGMADVAWQDIIRVSTMNGLSRPDSIRLRVGIDALIEFRVVHPIPNGVVDIDFFLNPWLWESAPSPYFSWPGGDMWNSQILIGINPVPSLYHWERVITINYDPALGGYPFAAHLRTRAYAEGVETMVDDSVSILAITDLDGFDLAGQGYRLSTDSGMNLSQNAPPLASAGEDRIVECISHAGAPVQLDGTGSSDPDGDSLTYQWSAAGIEFDDATSATPIALFPIGSTTVTLVVTDELGGMDSSDVIITVEDSVAPEITAVVTSQNALWAPNHQIVPVEVAVLLRDSCAEPQFLHVSGSVRSNERDDFEGDGSFTGDVNFADGYSAEVPIEVAFDPSTGEFRGTVMLRAERNDNPEGRKYSITIHAEDAFGNASVSTATVVVPRNQSKGGNR